MDDFIWLLIAVVILVLTFVFVILAATLLGNFAATVTLVLGAILFVVAYYRALAGDWRL